MVQRKYNMKKCKKCGGTGTLPNAIGGVLRSEREATGISLRKLASAMGRSESYLSDLELNRRDFDNELLELYLAALHKLLNTT